MDQATLIARLRAVIGDKSFIGRRGFLNIDVQLITNVLDEAERPERTFNTTNFDGIEDAHSEESLRDAQNEAAERR